MSRRVLIRLSLSLLTLGIAVAFTPSAEANCEWGHVITTTYYAHVDVWDPNLYWCQPPIISPPCPQCFSWQAIGEVTYDECNNTWSSWGDTTSCPENAEQTFYRCGLICQ